MEKMSEIELALRFLWNGYFALDNENIFDKFGFFWIDRDRRYLVFNTSYLKPGIPYAREGLIQLDDSPNKYPVRVEFEINQPRVAERYYSINSKIDERNCTRQ